MFLLREFQCLIPGSLKWQGFLTFLGECRNRVQVFFVSKTCWSTARRSYQYFLLITLFVKGSFWTSSPIIIHPFLWGPGCIAVEAWNRPPSRAQLSSQAPAWNMRYLIELKPVKSSLLYSMLCQSVSCFIQQIFPLIFGQCLLQVRASMISGGHVFFLWGRLLRTAILARRHEDICWRDIHEDKIDKLLVPFARLPVCPTGQWLDKLQANTFFLTECAQHDWMFKVTTGYLLQVLVVTSAAEAMLKPYTIQGFSLAW